MKIKKRVFLLLIQEIIKLSKMNHNSLAVRDLDLKEDSDRTFKVQRH